MKFTGSGTQTHTLPELSQIHKKIELSVGEALRISSQIVDLGQKGYSLAEISKQTGKAKTTVREILVRAGIDFRSPISAPEIERSIDQTKRNIRPFFGFCYSQGQIVPDKRESERLLQIYHLWRKGMNANAISDHLNAGKIVARNAKFWHRNTVLNIVKRFETELIIVKGDQYELG